MYSRVYSILRIFSFFVVSLLAFSLQAAAQVADPVSAIEPKSDEVSDETSAVDAEQPAQTTDAEAVEETEETAAQADAEPEFTEEDLAKLAQDNFEMGMVAFTQGRCSDAIPLLSNSVNPNTETDDLILVTQILSACFTATGDINRARVLMQQILPLIAAEKGRSSLDYMNHNMTWAEFELTVAENINAANRLTDGLTSYLGGDAVDATEAFRALAGYATIMVAQAEIDRFIQDVETLKAQNDQIQWSTDLTLVDLMADLPPLDGTPTSLAVWALTAMTDMPGVVTFQELLGAVIRGEVKPDGE